MIRLLMLTVALMILPAAAGAQSLATHLRLLPADPEADLPLCVSAGDTAELVLVLDHPDAPDCAVGGTAVYVRAILDGVGGEWTVLGSPAPPVFSLDGDPESGLEIGAVISGDATFLYEIGLVPGPDAPALHLELPGWDGGCAVARYACAGSDLAFRCISSSGADVDSGDCTVPAEPVTWSRIKAGGRIPGP